MSADSTTILPALVAMAAVVVLGGRGALALHPPRTQTDRSPTGRPSWFHPRLSRPTRNHPPSDVEVANWCDEMARGLRSGSSLTAAVVDSRPEHPALASILDPIIAQISRGRSLADALQSATFEPAMSSGLAFAVLRSCADLGGPAAAPLERVAATLRGRDAIRQEQQAQSAQARMSARVLTLVPVAMLGLLATVDPNVRAAVIAPSGVIVVVSGAALNLGGWWWMQRIIGRPR